MSCMKLGKKLLAARKAWKNFTSTLQTKLHKLKRSKSIKSKAKTRFSSTVSIFLRPIRSSPRLRRKPNKSRSQTPTAFRAHYLHKNFAPVFVDELFKKPVQEPVVPPSTIKVVEKAAPSSSAAANVGPKASAGKEAAAEVPLLGVDERAEQFIAKFREEMRIQRQRSFGEYQEMLARSVM